MRGRVKSLFDDNTVRARLGVSRSAFYRYLQRGVLTNPVGKLGKNRRGWTEQDITVAHMELEEAKSRAST